MEVGSIMLNDCFTVFRVTDSIKVRLHFALVFPWTNFEEKFFRRNFIADGIEFDFEYNGNVAMFIYRCNGNMDIIQVTYHPPNV